MKRINLAFLLFALAFLSCQKEKLTPSDPEPFYVLPQGDHAFDQRIVAFYNQYDRYILYKFDEIDFRWDFTQLIPFKGEQADPDYVPNALDFLDKQVFDYYEPDLLNAILPHRILLSSTIEKEDATNPDSIIWVAGHAAWSKSQIAFAHTNTDFTTLSDSVLLQAKGRMHGALWTSAVSNERIPIPQAFVDATDYRFVQRLNYEQYGLYLYSRDIYQDFSEYIYRLTCYTEEELESIFLNPERDPTGIYRKKYKAIVDAFSEDYNIDLHAIGNAKLK